MLERAGATEPPVRIGDRKEWAEELDRLVVDVVAEADEQKAHLAKLTSAQRPPSGEGSPAEWVSFLTDEDTAALAVASSAMLPCATLHTEHLAIQAVDREWEETCWGQ